MSSKWDSDKGGRDQWVAWLTEVMKETIRVLKPGSHALVWALPRNSHWTAYALENAGFEVRDEISHHFGTDTLIDNFLTSLNAEQVQCLEQILESQSGYSIYNHIFGSGFPKSTAIDKQIDRLFGKSAEREVVGWKTTPDGKRAIDRRPNNFTGEHEGWDRPWKHDREAVERQASVTAPATPESARFVGYGSALKPSHENWLLVRKPLSEKNLAANVLKWDGCGALNIDKCRVGYISEKDKQHSARPGHEGETSTANLFNPIPKMHAEQHIQGRFPSNTLFSHTQFCRPLGVKRVRSDGGPRKAGDVHRSNLFPMGQTVEDAIRKDGMEAVQDFECVDSCPVKILGDQSGVTSSHGGGSRYKGAWSHPFETGRPIPKGDTGTASRYFATFTPELEVPFYYCSKSSRQERNLGCEALPENDTTSHNLNSSDWASDARHPDGGYPRNPSPPKQNTHPCVKSLSLMKYLCKLVTPEGGIILDPFCGSGSTLVAAIQEGFSYIGIDAEEEYVRIAEARTRHAWNEVQGEMVQEWECVEECPVAQLDRQSGNRKTGKVSIHERHNTSTIYGNGKDIQFTSNLNTSTHEASEGGASRFFAQFPPDSLFAELNEEEPST